MKLYHLAFAGALFAANALAVPVTIHPGENVFFNFDLTAAAPGPVYDEIRITTNLSGFDGDELGTWNFYDDFGPPPGAYVGGQLFSNSPEFVTNIAGVVDGVFSVQLVLLAGSGSSVTVDPFVVGVDDTGAMTDAIPPVGVIPEPTTLALVAAGLAVLGLRRRRETTSRPH